MESKKIPIKLLMTLYTIIMASGVIVASSLKETNYLVISIIGYVALIITAGYVAYSNMPVLKEISFRFRMTLCFVTLLLELFFGLIALVGILWKFDANLVFWINDFTEVMSQYLGILFNVGCVWWLLLIRLAKANVQYYKSIGDIKTANYHTWWVDLETGPVGWVLFLCWIGYNLLSLHILLLERNLLN